MGSTIIKDDVAVTEGVFTVSLDFGDVFDGTQLWLQVQGRPGGSTGGYITLRPRSEITPVPYALYAAKVSEHDHFGEVWTGSGDSGLNIENSAPSGASHGLRAYVSSPEGDAVMGWAQSTTGVSFGTVGRSDSTEGIGVYGYALAATGSTFGVQGRVSSPEGIGVFGWNKSSTGDAHGVVGISDSAEGIGVYGYANATTGPNIAVLGRSNSIDGKGGAFLADGTNGWGIYAKGQENAAVFRGNVSVLSYGSGDLVVELGEGLDYAEGFDVSEESEIRPGTVLVIDAENPGMLAKSREPYDTKVAGIVAGANALGTGVRLGGDQYDYDVALAGRVYCYVDATFAAVEPGDMLTTSHTPGYAMAVIDHDRAQGAILGKAMEPLAKGQRGLILVLVTLQ